MGRIVSTSCRYPAHHNRFSVVQPEKRRPSPCGRGTGPWTPTHQRSQEVNPVPDAQGESRLDRPMPRSPRHAITVVRIQMVREGRFPYGSNAVSQSSDAAKIIQTYLAGADREYFVLLMLDGKHRVNALNLVAVGSLTAALVHPREVFKPAVLANAAAVIVAHNHPSGDTEPSREDRELTERLVKAGRLLGITVLDHVIVGE